MARRKRGIDLVGNRNRANGNSIKNSSFSGIYVLGKRNEVRENIINEAPVGIFEDTPSSNNHFGGNDFDSTGFNIVSVPSSAASTLRSLTAVPSGRNPSPARP